MKHLLISRTDNIGDLVLTLPMAAVLKQRFPGLRITWLGRDYVREVVEACEHVDAFESWDALSALSKPAAVARVQSLKIDAVIHVFPKKQIAKLMWQAGVKDRIGVSRRFYHWFYCNKRVSFSRVKSAMHEAQLNLKLLSPFGLSTEYGLQNLAGLVELKSVNSLSSELQSLLDPKRFHLIIHPFTNGNTREWPVSHFIGLIQSLPVDRIQIFITGSQKEFEKIEKEIMPHCEHAVNLAGKFALAEFLQLISACDGLVANSTGPLHLAAALGVHALGLFPATKGMDVGRWMPLGKKVQVLIADPGCQKPSCQAENDCFCLESITVEAVKNKILSWL